MTWHWVFCQNLWLITMEKNNLSTKHCWVLYYCDPSWKKKKTKQKKRKVYSYNIKVNCLCHICTNSCQLSWRHQQQSGKVPGQWMCADCELTQVTLIVPDWTSSLIRVGGQLCFSLFVLAVGPGQMTHFSFSSVHIVECLHLTSTWEEV